MYSMMTIINNTVLYWRRQWHPNPVLLPGKSHGQRSLVSCSPWGFEESDMTERLHFHFSLSRIGEGNSNPLQCSCLENPRDGGAWWAAVYGIAQSRTWLKRLRISSSSSIVYLKVAKRIELKSSSLTKKIFVTILVMNVSLELIIVIILQYMHIINSYAVHLRLLQCYVEIISQ